MQYTVEYMRMGNVAGGFVVDRGDDLYTIVLNQDTPTTLQQHTLKHELAHICLGHFKDSRPIIELESEAETEANTTE